MKSRHLIGAQGNKHITTTMSMTDTVFWINILHNFYFTYQPVCISALLCVAKLTPALAKEAGAKEDCPTEEVNPSITSLSRGKCHRCHYRRSLLIPFSTESQSFKIIMEDKKVIHTTTRSSPSPPAMWREPTHPVSLELSMCCGSLKQVRNLHDI